MYHIERDPKIRYYSRMKIGSTLNQIWHQAGTRFNLIFAGSVFGIQAAALGTLHDVLHNDAVSFTLGVLLVIGLFVETVALYWKWKEMRMNYPGVESSGVVFIVWFTHLVLGPILWMLALDAFGLDLESSAIGMIGIVAIVIRDLALFMFFMGLDPLPKDADIPKIRFKGKIADVMLVVFSITAYFLIWEGMLGDMTFRGQRFLATLGELIAAIMLFFFFYLSTRMGHFIEESYAIEAGKKETGLIITTALAGLAAIVPLYF